MKKKAKKTTAQKRMIKDKPVDFKPPVVEEIDMVTIFSKSGIGHTGYGLSQENLGN
ncbi:hypothetical protein [Flavipsychrobacter stenotrophus]|uniref:hypothetical protein n=1 Tax=Flavipsychrobacter stenotrophus TaxID=2077091 RepID=UPI0013752FC5|nr:hypothetical protein [Flavipsychrobacter stenotrophus]